jgi:hypothetical protein
VESPRLNPVLPCSAPPLRIVASWLPVSEVFEGDEGIVMPDAQFFEIAKAASHAKPPHGRHANAWHHLSDQLAANFPCA